MSELKELNTPKHPRGHEITGLMMLLEIIASIPFCIVWMIFVHVLGGVFPWGAITWAVVSFIWTFSPWADRFRDWLWEKLYV